MLTIIKNYLSYKYRGAGLAFLFILTIAGATIIPLQQARAFTPNYDSSNLIDNGTFVNNQTMSADAIQVFLTNTGSGLAGYSDIEACDSTIAPYYIHCGQTLSAAQLIYDASQAYDINPRAILATLEKEQSLVTDPTPTSSQIDCAMGYNSCSGSIGFFTQVDNGTWALAYNYQGALGTTNWLSWSPAAGYPCRNANSSFYSAGLYPGSTVVFTDSGGTAETITLANAATASLYCYTPYVGPLSVTGYSGSYNFVYYYQLWFGSTLASIPYAWNYVNQSAYADAAHTQPFTTGIPTVAPGGELYLQLQARNVGYQTWGQSNLHLGTDNPENSSSPFYNSSWLDSTRPGVLSTTTVAPGSTGTFDFILHAPSQPGTYYEYYNLVDDGVTWLNDPGVYYQINVVAPDQPTNTQNTGLGSGGSMTVGNYLLSPDTQSTFNLLPNGDLVEYENYKQVWSNNVTSNNTAYLVMQTDGNLVEYNSSGSALWASNTAGNSGATLTLQTDGNLVIYSSSGALWDTGTVNIPNHLDQVVESLPVGYLFPGQSLQNAAQTFRLVLQGDGNLVEYNSAGTPIWSSNTQGQSAAYLKMQSDGNLVLYNTGGQAVWDSQTEGSSSTSLTLQSNGLLSLDPNNNAVLWTNGKLYPGQALKTPDLSHKIVLQNDGNLVVYNNSGIAIWASNTAGIPSAYAVMQGDGNLVIYGTNDQSLWATGTNGNGTSYLSMQSDGNLVIYRAGGGAIWASNTTGE